MAEDKKRFNDPEWEKLMFALTDPDSFGKSDIALAKEVGISPHQLRITLQNPDFKEGLEKISKDRLASYLGRVVSTLINKAVHGSVNHQRLVFELLGMVEGKFKGGFGLPGGDVIKIEMPGLDAEKMAKLAHPDEEPEEEKDAGKD